MKKEIRRQIISQRLALSSDEVKLKSEKITNFLLNLPEWQHAHTVMSYLSFRQEVDTAAVISRAFAEGKQVVIPVCMERPRQLLASRLLDTGEDLVPGTWGILEPKPEALRPVHPAEIDLVLVPGVAFDRCGNRLGYGAGYYDRFLRSLGPQAKAVALAYQLQVLEHIEAEEHDYPVDLVVTEEGVIDCSIFRSNY
ncbi:MAG: 5-formyltetrahydrofolate cyclo-ligase [Bacillota bacterium]